MDNSASPLTVKQNLALGMIESYPDDSVVLDVPIGNGGLMPYYAAHDFIVIAVDDDKNKCDKSHALGKELGIKGGIVIDGSYVRLRLNDKSIDISVSIGGVDSMTDDELATFLSELSRVTRKAIVIDLPADRCIAIDGWHISNIATQFIECKAMQVITMCPDKPYVYGSSPVRKNSEIGVRIKRRYLLAEMIRQHGWKTGAEIGVNRGGTTFYLLRQCPDFEIIAVDNWAQDNPIYGDMTETRRAFLEEARRYGDRCVVFEGDSAKMAQAVVDESLDMCFVDCDHSYESVVADIAAWAPKVKKGGYVMGHDIDFPEVARAVKDTYGTWTELDDDVWMVVKS